MTKRNPSFKICDDKDVPARLIPENQGPRLISLCRADKLSSGVIKSLHVHAVTDRLLTV